MGDPTDALMQARSGLQGIGNEIEDGDFKERAQRLVILRDVIAMAKQLEADLELLLAETMESDSQLAPGVGWMVREKKAPSTAGSDWNGMRREVAALIVTEVATHPETGEVLPAARKTAERALSLWMRHMTAATPKLSAQDLGFDPDQFYRYSDAGYTVRLHEEGAEG